MRDSTALFSGSAFSSHWCWPGSRHLRSTAGSLPAVAATRSCTRIITISSPRRPAALLKVQCRSGSELAVGRRLQDLMRRMLQILAALVVLSAVWPAPHALATSGKHTGSAAGCDDALSAHEASGNLCEAVCQPASALGVHHAQAP